MPPPSVVTECHESCTSVRLMNHALPLHLDFTTSFIYASVRFGSFFLLGFASRMAHEIVTLARRLALRVFFTSNWLVIDRLNRIPHASRSRTYGMTRSHRASRVLTAFISLYAKSSNARLTLISRPSPMLLVRLSPIDRTIA